MLMKKTLLSRRGVAIEMAVGVMLIMLAVSIILLSLATIKVDRQNDDLADLNTKVTLDEIGEYVCEEVCKKTDTFNEEPQIIKYNGEETVYSATKTIDTETKNITLVITEDDAVALTIVLTESGRIISWK